MKKFRWKAIVWGVFASFISAIVSTVPLVTVIILILRFGPASEIPKIDYEDVKALGLENAGDWMGLTLGLIGFSVGGYVVGRIAKTDIYLNCGALIALQLALSIPFLSADLRGFDFLVLALIIPETLFGGIVAKQMNHRIELRSEPPSRGNENGEF